MKIMILENEILNEILKFRRINSRWTQKIGGLSSLPPSVLEDILSLERYNVSILKGHMVDLELQKLNKEIENEPK